MKRRSEPARTLIDSPDEIPAFATEDEERRFWDTHEVSDELAARAEPLPGDVVALLDHIRENRARRTAAMRSEREAATGSGETPSTRRP